MKRTQMLDARRNIRKEFVAFFSILMIGMLAAMAFLSVSYTAATLKKDALHFFNSNEMWDLEVASTLLLDDDDLADIRALPGVIKAEPVYQLDTRLLTDGFGANVSIISMTETISQPVLLEGRLPVTVGECAVEKELLDSQELSLGQQISVEAATISGIDPLPGKSFVITGVFQSPDHITYMVPATPYILVRPECFDRESLDDCYMKIRVRLNAPEDRYSSAYWETVTPVEDALRTMETTNAAARTETIRSTYDEMLRDSRAQLEEGKEQLRAGQEKIESGYRELEAAAEQLHLGKEQLDFGEGVLNVAGAQIGQGAATLRELSALLESLRPYVSMTENEILAQVPETSWPAESPISYQEFERQLADGKVTMAWLYDITGYNDGRKALEQAEAQLEAARLQWYYLGEEYLDGMTRLELGRKQLEEGEQELADGQAKIDSAEQELKEKQEELDRMEAARWIILNNRANAGCVYAQVNYEKLSSLSMTFSSIFLIVGALVIYATVGRMVEQQRKLVGATKAMGFYNREIFAKYLIFACGASLTGVLLGILLSWLPLQRAVLATYEKLFCYGEGTRSFLPRETALVVGGALGISAAAVYLGCRQLLRLPAIRLMQGTPPAGGRKKARRSASKALYTKLIFLNMRTDWRRVLVTTVSISGGCLLMVVGFTLRYGISGVTPKQFGEVMTYDAEVYYNADENPDAGSELEDILNRNGLSHVRVRKETGVFEASGTLEAESTIVAEDGVLEGFYSLRSIADGAPAELPASGALVPRRFHEHFKVQVGETLTVYDSKMRPCTLRVADVFENYFGQLFFLTPQAYEEIFGVQPVENCLFVKTNGMTLDQLQEKVAGVQGFVRVADAASERILIDRFSSSLTFVVWFMLFLAALMACFIVANFTMIYIQRKTSELTIMRINGFSTGACIRYAAIDLIVTTVLGTVLGLVLGGFLGSFILHVTETPYIQMIRQPVLQSFLYSALITCGFAALTNGFALRRVRKLKLSDIS